MQREIPLPQGCDFTWIILVDPTPDEARAFGEEHELHPAAVRDFLLHPHLPKYERLDDQRVILLRSYDEKAKRGDTFSSMTRRLLLIVKKGLLVTVVRREQPFLSQVLASLELRGPRTIDQLILLLSTHVLRTYEEPLKEAEERMDALEKALFERKIPPHSLKQIYGIKRQCSVIKRILWRSLGILGQLKLAIPSESEWLSDLREETDRLHAWADELQDNASHLTAMEVSIAGHRTNEVMRVLTVFSAFFLPLTFIVGVYGMNFKNMPELGHPFGYPAVWAVMILVVVSIFLWFRRKGWLR